MVDGDIEIEKGLFILLDLWVLIILCSGTSKNESRKRLESKLWRFSFVSDHSLSADCHCQILFSCHYHRLEKWHVQSDKWRWKIKSNKTEMRNCQHNLIFHFLHEAEGNSSIFHSVVFQKSYYDSTNSQIHKLNLDLNFSTSFTVWFRDC